MIGGSSYQKLRPITTSHEAPRWRNSLESYDSCWQALRNVQ